MSSHYLSPMKTRFQHSCFNGLVTTVQQYWASETVNCFPETGMLKYTHSHTAFL